MTAAITPGPAAIRPEPREPAGEALPWPAAQPYDGPGSTSLRVGVTTLWLSLVAELREIEGELATFGRKV